MKPKTHQKPKIKAPIKQKALPVGEELQSLKAAVLELSRRLSAYDINFLQLNSTIDVVNMLNSKELISRNTIFDILKHLNTIDKRIDNIEKHLSNKNIFKTFRRN